MSDDDLIGGFSISISELMHNPADGWFRLLGWRLNWIYSWLTIYLGPDEAEFYNIPMAYSDDKMERIREDLFEDSDDEDEEQMTIDDFEIKGLIGFGGFGKIILAIDQNVYWYRIILYKELFRT